MNFAVKLIADELHGQVYA